MIFELSGPASYCRPSPPRRYLFPGAPRSWPRSGAAAWGAGREAGPPAASWFGARGPHRPKARAGDGLGRSSGASLRVARKGAPAAPGSSHVTGRGAGWAAGLTLRCRARLRAPRCRSAGRALRRPGPAPQHTLENNTPPSRPVNPQLPAAQRVSRVLSFDANSPAAPDVQHACVCLTHPATEPEQGRVGRDPGCC